MSCILCKILFIYLTGEKREKDQQLTSAGSPPATARATLRAKARSQEFNPGFSHGQEPDNLCWTWQQQSPHLCINRKLELGTRARHESQAFGYGCLPQQPTCLLCSLLCVIYLGFIFPLCVSVRTIGSISECTFLFLALPVVVTQLWGTLGYCVGCSC